MTKYVATLRVEIEAETPELADRYLGDLAGTNDAAEMLANTTLVPVPEPPVYRSTNREANERFVHLKNVDVEVEASTPRLVAHVTAFIRTDKDGKTYAAFAECDSRDPFNRKKGRTTARRKWFAGKKVLFDDTDKTLYDTALSTWMLN